MLIVDKKVKKQPDQIRLHLGCGDRYHSWFTHHIDLSDKLHVDIVHDASSLPMFINGSVDMIYASHILEYFDSSEVVRVLAEWRRVLKAGGLLRLAVPDFAALCVAYNRGFPIFRLTGPLYGKMNIGKNQHIYHKMCYDYLSLSSLLRLCQFNRIRRYEWRETEHADMDDWSQSYLPHMDKDNGLLISLNVECNKI